MRAARQGLVRSPARAESHDHAPYTNRISGQPLPGNVREAFQPRFGHDFGHVRVHAGPEASAMVEDVGARAAATGDDIWFADGAFAPETPEGMHLLAHELAHVVQSSNGGGRSGAVSEASDAAEVEASTAADTVMIGGQANVTGPAGAAVARKEEKGDSIFSTLADLYKAPKEIAEYALPGVDPISSVLGALGGVDKAAHADSAAGQGSGMLGFGSGVLGLTKWLGSDTLGESAGKVGGIGGLLSAGSSALDAYEDFSKGNTGKGLLNSVKGVGSSLSGLAEFGGFELGSVAEMGAGEALLGGGAEGLAALGPVGAVIGAGMAGVGVGTYLNDETSVGEHSVESMGGLDAMLTGEGDRPWALTKSEAMEDNWDQGNYFSAAGDAAQLAGFATVGALGGIGGGVVDAAKWLNPF